MYQVQLIDNEKILKGKDFLNYDKAYSYSDGLIVDLRKGYKVLLLEKKEDGYKTIRSLALE